MYGTCKKCGKERPFSWIGGVHCNRYMYEDQIDKPLFIWDTWDFDTDQESD